MHLIPTVAILIAVLLTPASSNHESDRMKRGILGNWLGQMKDSLFGAAAKVEDKTRGMVQEAGDSLKGLQEDAKDWLIEKVEDIKGGCPTELNPKDIGTVAPVFRIKRRDSPSEFEHKILSDKEINDQKLYEGNTYFKKNRPVVFIVHGFLGANKWQTKMADEILKAEDSTVVIVEWDGGSVSAGSLLGEVGDKVSSSFSSSGPFPWKLPDIYWQARVNTRTTAWAISAFAAAISKSKIFKDDPTSLYLHCIGHSLGAQICGQAGKLAGIFDRVSGLDPARPGFENCPDLIHRNMTLDKRSAQCVDVIHSNTDLFGYKAPLGNIDFYANCGHAQWECGVPVLNVRNPACSHSRSIQFFTASIDQSNPCQALGPCNGRVGESMTNPCLKLNTNPHRINRVGFYSVCHRKNLDKMELSGGVYYFNTEKGGGEEDLVKCVDHRKKPKMECPKVGYFTVKDKK